ncbi:MAG: protein kinase [Thermoanaerobaculia bacterium]|nr:protein kinase [Thermoanaerobaculia bacterium]
MDESSELSRRTTIPNVARRSSDPWLPALSFATLGLVALVIAASLHAAAFLDAANPGFRFGSLSGRVVWHSDAWQALEPGDALVRVDGQNVEGDPAAMRRAFLALEPRLLHVEARRGAERILDSAVIGPYTFLEQSWTWSRVVTGALLILLGALAAALRPAAAVSRIFFAFCATLAVHLLSYLAFLPDPGLGLVIEAAGLWLCCATGVHFFATFPRSLIQRRWPLAVVYVPMLAASLFVLLFVRSTELLSEVGAAIQASRIAAILATLASVWLLVQQLRSARQDEDEAAMARAKSLLSGVGLGLLPAATLQFLPFFERDVDWAFNSFAVVIFAVVTSHAIVRRNVLDVDRFTAALVGYSATLILLTIGFGAVVIGIPSFLGQSGRLDSPVAVATVTGLVFLVIQPIYRRIRRWVDRYFQREPVSPGTEVQILQTLADTVRDVDVPAALRAGVEAALVLGVERCELWTKSANGGLVPSISEGPGPAASGLIRSDTTVTRPTQQSRGSARTPPTSDDRPRSLAPDDPLIRALHEGSGGTDGLSERPFDPPAQEQLWQLDLAMAAPILARRRVEAMLAVARKRSGDAFTSADRVFLDAVASQIAMALERDWQEALRVGPYRLLGRLGTGGMAEVFLAEKRGPGGFERQVALKRILPHLEDDADAVTYFLDEARIAAQLRYPNIVQVYDIEVFDGTYYLAMELMDGPSLYEILRRSRKGGGALALPVVAHFAVALLSALGHAHRQADVRGRPMGIVHRDVKPANVLTSRHGEVKLGDFGIARAESRLHQTEPGLARGTPAYMAPEVQSGDAEASIASDLFAAGIVLFEMLTLRRSYVTGLTVSITQQIPLPKSLGGDRIDRLEVFFCRALAAKPEDRFASADDMKSSFLSALDSAPADAEAVAELIALLEPQPRRVDSRELNAFRPAKASETSVQTI